MVILSAVVMMDDDATVLQVGMLVGFVFVLLVLCSQRFA